MSDATKTKVWGISIIQNGADEIRSKGSTSNRDKGLRTERREERTRNGKVRNTKRGPGDWAPGMSETIGEVHLLEKTNETGQVQPGAGPLRVGC